MEERKENFFIESKECEFCSGLGRKENGGFCNSCEGIGGGLVFENKFFYWGYDLSRSAIRANFFKRLISSLLNVIAYFLSLAGLLAIAFWLWKKSEVTHELGAFIFWREHSIYILFFWIGLLADMFIIYRTSEARRLNYKIKRKKWSRKKDGKEITVGMINGDIKNIKNKIDVSRAFSSEFLRYIEKSFASLKKEGRRKLSIARLFFETLRDRKIAAIFSRLNLDMRSLAKKMVDYLSQEDGGVGKVFLDKDLKTALVKSYVYAYTHGGNKVDPASFVVPALDGDKGLEEIFYDLEVKKSKLVNCLEWFKINDKIFAAYQAFKKQSRFKPTTNMDRAYTAIATPMLNSFSYDLTVAAKIGRLDFCVAREREIETIFEKIESGQFGILLIGPSGIGKKTIISGIAELMVSEDVPEFLKDKRLVEVDASRLIAGATPDQAQERLLIIIDEVRRAGNVILFINNIENITGITIGDGESLDLSEVLSGAIERREIVCLASINNSNYKKIENSALAEGMAKIEIGEPKGDMAIKIIASKIGFLEGKYKVYFSYDALEEAVELSVRFMKEERLPEKAIKILEETAIKTVKNNGEKSLITREDVAAVVGDITHIPTVKVTADEGKNLLNLENKIHERMIGQEEAVNAVAASLRRARAELKDDGRPIASFLFLGPTGVGKTELAKTVSQVYFGDEKYMIRLDMSEYQEQDSIKKMIGDPSGISGYLTEAVRKSPFALILLDEIEKAHPDILNLFLQVMDDGRLTDGQGRTIDFTNAIIIATSNAGALYIQESVRRKESIEKIKEGVINEELNKVMRPELINRFDGIIVFKPLTINNVVAITRLMLKKVEKMLEEKGIFFKAEEAGLKIIADAGFDPQFGARPLRRVIQDKVENDIANKTLSGELARLDTVLIDRNGLVTIIKKDRG